MHHYPNALDEVMKRCKTGLKEKNLISKQYLDRFKKELLLIKEKGYLDYFLVLSDIVEYCNENDIGIGVGRGSAAGCLISYLLGITKLDPIEYELIFERFINPDRESWPDIDIDIQSARRDKLKEHIIEKYGSEYVCNVGTRLITGLKSILQDVARVYEIPAKETVKITKVLSGDELSTKLDTKSGKGKALKAYFDKYPEVQKHATILAGTCRSFGMHAGGLIISNKKLTETMPIMRTNKGFSSGWCESGGVRELESAGFIKYDLLGLSAVDLIEDTIVSVRKRHNIKLKESDLLKEREEVFKEIFQKLRLAGLFQFISPLAYDMVEKIKPEGIHHLADINTLIRPGCLQAGVHHHYISRKNGSEYYEIPKQARRILDSTYGLIIYQEQIQLLLSHLTNGEITLGEADIIRRLIEKTGYIIDVSQESQELEQARQKFFKHSVLNPSNTEEIWNSCRKAAAYLFNKSHSMTYSANAYIQATLKLHYPLEYFCSLFNNTSEKEVYKGQNMLLSDIKAATREFNINILPCDVNTSKELFSINDKND